jgi:hypothetical protein
VSGGATPIPQVFASTRNWGSKTIVSCPGLALALFIASVKEPGPTHLVEVTW